MSRLLRSLALVAYLLPALLVPRDLPIGVWLCGADADARVCSVGAGSLAPPPCDCCGPTEAAGCCDSSAGGRSEGDGVLPEERCPHCRLVALEEAPCDFVGTEPTPAFASLHVTAWVAAEERPVPPVAAAAVRPGGRAPPPGATSPGLWPGVVPLRI